MMATQMFRFLDFTKIHKSRYLQKKRCFFCKMKETIYYTSKTTESSIRRKLMQASKKVCILATKKLTRLPVLQTGFMAM